MIAWGKVQPLLAFVVVAMLAALMLGMPLAKIPGAIEKGIGDLLGSLTVVICLGAVFGKLIADSGAARRIAISGACGHGQDAAVRDAGRDSNADHRRAAVRHDAEADPRATGGNLPQRTQAAT
nr:GntP family permease [Duganella sp. sic0402]